MDKNINDINRPQSDKPKTGVADKVGEKMEKAGHKISEMGMPGLGQKIHDLGDKVEKTHKNPDHPHDV